jgi:hypothetical protein
LSPSNLPEELAERRRLFFAKGALEFWVCGLDGQMAYFDPAGTLPQSGLCPGFPKQLSLD